MITKETCIWCNIEYHWWEECRESLKEKFPEDGPDWNSERSRAFRKDFREKRKQDCVEIDPRIEETFYLCKKHLGELKEEILNFEDEFQ